MKNIGIKLAAVAFLVLAATPAYAGKGGSAGKIREAIASGSQDAIIAEVERAEALACEECIQLVTNLTEDNRYAVREVAAWWFARRPAMAKMLATGFIADLANGNSIEVRNAADFLGASRNYTGLPALRAAIKRADVDAEAKLAMVRAVKFMGHQSGNPVLTVAMGDANADVRAAAANAWRDIRGQANAMPVVALLSDESAYVRAEAATTIGGLLEASGRVGLETLVTSDADPVVRRNAAWALGQLGHAASKGALTLAAGDKSGLVRMTARVSLGQLK
jgi:HEAT repeat protein